MRVAYGRVSTQEQADVGALERQERALLAACKPDELLLDVGSGTTTNRRGYQRLLQLIQTGQVEQVLVKEQDRLNRNLQADLELWALCAANGTKITDLHGREIEFQTPDGTLLSTMVSAFNQHRSGSYGLKTREGIERSRNDGMPAVASVPFGIKKVREEHQLVGLEVDPDRRLYAQERVDKFLEIGTLNGTVNWINQNHPDGCKVEVSSLRRWLTHPNLTGRLCHTRDKKTEEFAYVAPEKSFEALISDDKAEQVKALVGRRKTTKALAGRTPRPLTGLCRCAHCGTTSVYKQNKSGLLYMKCGNSQCSHRHKFIREELITTAIALAIRTASENVAKVLYRPDQDPPKARKIVAEIKRLETMSEISGVDELINSKKKELAAARASKGQNTLESLALAITHPKIWLQPDEWINRYLHSIIDCIYIKYRETSREARVCSIQFKPEIDHKTYESDPKLRPGEQNEKNYNYMNMLVAQEWAVRDNYKGWNWEDLAKGYLPSMKERLKETNQILSNHLEEGEPDPEIVELLTQDRGQLHGQFSQLKKIEPRLNQLYAELGGRQK